MTTLIEKYNFPFSLKDLIIWGIIALLAYMVGVGTIKIVAEKTLGSIFRNYIPAFVIVLVLLFFLFNRDNDILKMIFDKSTISFKSALIGTLIAVGLGFVVPFFAGWGMLYVPVLIVLCGSFLISIYFLINGNVCNAIITFILSYPFILFLQWEFKNIKFLGIYNPLLLGPFSLNPDFVFLLTIFLLFVLLYFYRQTKYKERNRSFLNVSVMIYGIALFISVVMSGDILFSARKFFLGPGMFIMVYILISNNVNTMKEVNKVLLSTVSSMFLLILLSNYFYWQNIGNLIFNPEASYGSMYEFPVFMMGTARSIIILFCIPILLALLLLSKDLKKKMIFLSGILLLLLGVFTQQTRAPIIVLAISLLFFIKNRILYIPLIIVLSISMIYWNVIIDNYYPRFKIMYESKSLYVIDRSRVSGLKGGLEMGLENPIVGVGFGMWGKNVHLYSSPEFYRNEFGQFNKAYLRNPHNQILSYFSETGIIGLLGWIILTVTVMKETLYIYRRANNDFSKTIALAFLSIFTGMLVGGLARYTPITQTPLFFAILVGLLIPLKKICVEKSVS